MNIGNVGSKQSQKQNVYSLNQSNFAACLCARHCSDGKICNNHCNYWMLTAC